MGLSMVFVGTSAFAKTIKDTSITNQNVQAQVDSINSLTTQIKALQAERKSKLFELVTLLRQGAKGDGVQTLQTLLSLDPSIYPEGTVDGSFGKLTKKAVQRFQAKNGLVQDGSVGPKTIEKLKKFADDNSLTVDESDEGKKGSENSGENKGKGKTKRLCAIIPPGHLIAPGLLKKGGVRPQVPTCQTLPKGIKDKIDGVKPLPDSTDKTAPVISSVTTTEITAVSVKFNWTTDEISKSKVWYGTVNPLVLGSATLLEDNAFVTGHSVAATSLTPNTIYYFVVGSVDASGNESKSTQGTFTTPADTAGPVISLLVTSDVTSTGAKITWTTNEGAKDKVWYGTVNPVVTSGDPTVEDITLRTAHTFNLTGLVAGTAYYYVVSSTDTLGNVTVSTQGTFTTLP